VDVLGSRIWRVTPPFVVTDEVRHGDDGLIAVRRKIDTERAQLSEVRVIGGIGARNRTASNQRSASHHGNGKSGYPADGGQLVRFLTLGVDDAI
jgi:hypothetical protein